MNKSTTSTPNTFMAVFPLRGNDRDLIDLVAAKYMLVADLKYDYFSLEGKWETVMHALEVFKGGRLVLA